MDIEDRLVALESKTAFQEDLIETLNEIVAEQQREIDKLWNANRVLNERLKEMRENGGGSPENEPPPPHY